MLSPWSSVCSSYTVRTPCLRATHLASSAKTIRCQLRVWKPPFISGGDRCKTIFHSHWQIWKIKFLKHWDAHAHSLTFWLRYLSLMKLLHFVPSSHPSLKDQSLRDQSRDKIWENMRKWIKLIKEAMTGSRIWTWIDLDGIGAFAAFAFRCFRWDRSFINFLCLKCSKLCNIHRTRMPNSVRLHSPSRINPAKVISPPQLQLNSSVARCLCQYKAQHNFSRKWQQERISKIMACWWFPSLEKFEAPPEVWFPSLSRLTMTNISCKHYYTESTWWELGTTIFFGVSVHQVFLVSLPLIQVALSI